MFEKNATGVWLMNLISPGGYEVGVYGGFSKLSNPKHAAQQQVTRDGCTTRWVTSKSLVFVSVLNYYYLYYPFSMKAFNSSRV